MYKRGHMKSKQVPGSSFVSEPQVPPCSPDVAPLLRAAALKSNVQELTVALNEERDTHHKQSAKARQENSRLLVELSELKRAVDKAALEVEERSKTAMEGDWAATSCCRVPLWC